MTRMLEKMAKAMWVAGDPVRATPVIDGYWSLKRDEYTSLARAALLAIREPDERVVTDMLYAPIDGKTVFGDVDAEAKRLEFQAGIDAILNEKPETT